MQEKQFTNHINKLNQIGQMMDIENQQQMQNVQINYLTFEQLEESSNFSIEQFVINLNNGKDWKLQFDSLDQARRLNKYNSSDFCINLLPNIYQQIIELADSIRSCLSKNALILIKEILLVNKLSNIQSVVIENCIRTLFEKAISDKSFLKIEAKEGIKAIESNKSGLHSVIINSLCLHCYDKNPLIMELSCQSLQNLLKSNEQNIKTIETQALKTILNTLSCNLQGKRAVMKKISQELSIFLKENLGIQIFDMLNENDKKIIMINMDQKKVTQQSFQDFIKNKKTEDKNVTN